MRLYLKTFPMRFSENLVRPIRVVYDGDQAFRRVVVDFLEVLPREEVGYQTTDDWTISPPNIEWGISLEIRRHRGYRQGYIRILRIAPFLYLSLNWHEYPNEYPGYSGLIRDRRAHENLRNRMREHVKDPGYKEPVGFHLSYLFIQISGRVTVGIRRAKVRGSVE